MSEVLKIGEMPKPICLPLGKNKWIGMRAYNLDKEIAEFLWWDNFYTGGNLKDELARYHAAACITRLHLQYQSEFAYGLPIDLRASDPRRNKIELVQNSKKIVYGIYVERSHRRGFNFDVMITGVRTEREMRAENPVEFERIFKKAKEVLPYHPD